MRLSMALLWRDSNTHRLAVGLRYSLVVEAGSRNGPAQPSHIGTGQARHGLDAGA